MPGESNKESSSITHSAAHFTHSASHTAAHSSTYSATQSDLEQSEEESYNGVWYWNSSSEDDISDSEKGKGNNQEQTVEPNDTGAHQASVMTQQALPSAFSILGWKKNGDKHL